MKALSALSDGLVFVERIVGRLLILGFVGLITVNVAMRYGGGEPILFAEELAAILLAWLAFVAISISVHDRAQVAVTLLTNLLSKRAQRTLDRVIAVIIIAMMAALLWAAITWVLSPMVEFEQVITTGWPKAPFFFIVPIFCATTLVHVTAQLFKR